MKANEMIDAVKNGKRILIKSYTRPMIIDAKCVARFEKAGVPLLTDDGDNYRITQGKNRLYVFASAIALID